MVTNSEIIQRKIAEDRELEPKYEAAMERLQPAIDAGWRPNFKGGCVVLICDNVRFRLSAAPIAYAEYTLDVSVRHGIPLACGHGPDLTVLINCAHGMVTELGLTPKPY